MIDRLSAEAGVRRIKATYWYAMDMKDWDRLAGVFTPDAVFDMRGERAHALGATVADVESDELAIAPHDPAVTIGATAIAAFIRDVVAGWITVHHGAAPIIDVIAPDRATAIWPFFDFIDDGRHALRGYGHYHDEYRALNGEWRISRCRITRIRTDGTHPWSAQALETKA